MENATRRNRKSRRQGLTRAPAGKEHTQRSTPRTEQAQRAGRPIGSNRPSARKTATLTNRKAERAAKSQEKAVNVARAVMPKRRTRATAE